MKSASEIVRSFTIGKAARCGFSLNGYKDPEKIAERGAIRRFSIYH